jgi:uncharacterized repeat protein (TIGR01451 family)
VALGTTCNATATALASSSASDPNSANNVATNSSPVLLGADISVSMSHAGPVTAGSSATFTALVRNAGPAPAADLVLTFELSSGLSFRSGSGCTAAGPTVTCLVSSLGSGSSRSVAVSVNVDPAAVGSVSVSASVTASTTDPDVTNNGATDTASVAVSANLAATLTHSGSFVAGGTGVYSLRVTNSGPSPAAGSVLVLALPSEFSFVSATGASCSAAGATVTCALGDLAPSASVPFAVMVAVAVGTSGNATATATVSSSASDPNSANNVATNSSPVLLGADLTVSVSHTGTVTAGLSATFTALVRNAGSASAADVVLTFVLPAGLTFRSGSGCTAAGLTVTCRFSSLGSGSSRSVALSVNVLSSAAGTVVVSASVATSTSDSDATNDTATDTATLVASANLAVTLQRSGTFRSGAAGVYSLKVSNGGPSDATAVVTTIVLPTGLTFVSAAGVTCSAVGQTVTCTLGDMVAHASTPFTVTVAISATGSVTTTASVSSATNDPTPANNSVSTATTVAAP